MSVPHFFIEEAIAGREGDAVAVSLPPEVRDHMRSLRLRAREHVVLVDAPGHGWELELNAVPGRHPRSVEGVLIRELAAPPRLALTLVQGISAADRMDQTIRQVTELGVGRVIPLGSERSTVRLVTAHDRAAKRERWQRVARSAAEQSGRLELPVIEAPVGLAAALGMVEAYDVLLFFWEEPGGHPLARALREAGVGEGEGVRACEAGIGEGEGACEASDCLKTRHSVPDTESNGSLMYGGGCSTQTTRIKKSRQGFSDSRAGGADVLRVAVFVGPEGGFSAAEAALIKAAGAQTVTLGDTILRTETAAVVACALTLYELGALGALPAPGAPHAR